jgi:hypothetical protein
MPRLKAVRSLSLDRASGPGRRAHVSAASGLALCGEHLYVIADDELHLAAFRATGRRPGRLLPLLPGTLPAARKPRKKAKPDFEVLVLLPAFAGHPHGLLLAFGSGSRPNRCTAAALALDAHGAVTGPPLVVDLSDWYRPLAREFDELNIEGAFIDGHALALLQRGNKGDARNARIRVPLPPLLSALAGKRPPVPAPPLAITPFDLGDCSGVPLCFTDAAALPGRGFVFTAVAEDTNDSYADGPCAGSAIGVVDGEDRVVALWRLDPPLKVEGIALRATTSSIRIRVVTDADDASVAGRLLEARLRWPG